MTTTHRRTAKLSVTSALAGALGIFSAVSGLNHNLGEPVAPTQISEFATGGFMDDKPIQVSKPTTVASVEPKTTGRGRATYEGSCCEDSRAWERDYGRDRSLEIHSRSLLNLKR